MRQLNETEIESRIRELHEEAEAWRRSQAAGTARPLGKTLRRAAASGLRRAAAAIEAARPEDRELQVMP